jgi:hypothetical protein
MADHPRAGEPTHFPIKIQIGTKHNLHSEMYYEVGKTAFGVKIHTIRENFPLWEKRMKKVNEGKAVIDLFYWEKPGGYYTKDNKQIVFATLDKDSGCGVQELIFSPKWGADRINAPMVNNSVLDNTTIANNDGLFTSDYIHWFRNYDLSQPFAIIHFTSFRY